MTLEEAGASVEAVASAEEARREMMEEAPDHSDLRYPNAGREWLFAHPIVARGGVSTRPSALTALARREDADVGAGCRVPAANRQTECDVAGLVDAVARLVHTVH
jgi:hypothetical protein